MTVYYKLEYYDLQSKKYVLLSTGKDIERLKIFAAKPYANYYWMGRKRITRIASEVIWKSIIPRKK